MKPLITQQSSTPIFLRYGWRFLRAHRTTKGDVYGESWVKDGVEILLYFKKGTVLLRRYPMTKESKQVKWQDVNELDLEKLCVDPRKDLDNKHKDVISYN